MPQGGAEPTRGTEGRRAAARSCPCGPKLSTDLEARGRHRMTRYKTQRALLGVYTLQDKFNTQSVPNPTGRIPGRGSVLAHYCKWPSATGLAPGTQGGPCSLLLEGEMLELMEDTRHDEETPRGRWALDQRAKGMWKRCCSQMLSLVQERYLRAAIKNLCSSPHEVILGVNAESITTQKNKQMQ